MLQVADVKLSDWRYEPNWHDNYWWVRDVDMGDEDLFPSPAVSLEESARCSCTVSFHWELKYLNDIFPNQNIVGTIDEVKKQVDDFLVRMDKLIAFM
jgi:hypothetical protein